MAGLAAWAQMRLRAQFPGFDCGLNLTMEGLAMLVENRFHNIEDMLEYCAEMRGRRAGRAEGRRGAAFQACWNAAIGTCINPPRADIAGADDALD